MLRSALWRQKGWKIMGSKSMRKMMHARKKPCTRKPRGGRSGIMEVAYEWVLDEGNQQDDMCSARTGFKNKPHQVLY